MLPTGGTTWHVHAGNNLQTTLDAAQRGDVIVLDAGATFTGNFKLPVKTGTGSVYIISSNLASLPKEGYRVSPANAVNMPKITGIPTANRPTLAFFKNANHYRFVGIEINNTTTISNFNVIISGYTGDYSQPSYTWTAVTNDADLPSWIIFDRCYIHNTNVYPLYCRCGFIMNGHYMAVVDSYFKNFVDTADAQAINIVQGTGPYKIVNNYLEASGENFMVGGTDPAIPNANAQDIEFRGNYLYKDKAAWFIGGAQRYTIKNLFELKNGRRVLCTGNWMENCYQDNAGQGATAIVLTVRDQSGNNTNAQLQDITITNNRIHTCGKAWRLTGYDDLHTSLQTQRVLIENNAFDDINNLATIPNCGQISSTSAGPALDVTIRHNLFIGTTSINTLLSLIDGSAPYYKVVKNLTYENNIICHSDYGLFGNVVGTGTVALTTYADGYSFTKNVMIDRPIDIQYSYWLTHLNLYPAGNAMADNFSSVGFTNFAGANYALTTSSPYHNWGSDGKDPGPNWTTLNLAIAHAKDGQVGTIAAPQNFSAS